MTRIKIKDLPKDKTVSDEELKNVRGGLKIAPSYYNLPRLERLSSLDILSRRFNAMDDL